MSQQFKQKKNSEVSGMSRLFGDLANRTSLALAGQQPSLSPSAL
jgi:hypothetical protein